MQIDSNLLKGYQTALRIAIEQFASADPAELAERCGAEYDPASSTTRLSYLGDTYIIDRSGTGIRLEGVGDEVPITVKVLLLNYLIAAQPMACNGELIAFRDLPSAATYEPIFKKRAVSPLIRTFDGKPELFLAAAKQLGGEPADVADVAARIPVLPLLELTYAVWHTEDEFPPHGTILFDASARRLMNAECMVVAASNCVYRLMGIAGELAEK
jgi:hypothetical protein